MNNIKTEIKSLSSILKDTEIIAEQNNTVKALRDLPYIAKDMSHLTKDLGYKLKEMENYEKFQLGYDQKVEFEYTIWTVQIGPHENKI